MSAENVAIVRAFFEGDVDVSKEAILAALPEIVPAMFVPDAGWIEAPERVDAKVYRGQDGILQSFERWLAQWSEYRIEPECFEDHGDQVFVVLREYGEGRAAAPRQRPSSTRFSPSGLKGGSLSRVLRRVHSPGLH